ncbi:MAG: efflux RND transporter periplasmic adaptor subunit [Kiritimatiellae bacterium]|nr:efflux RND transporter periplasmic adaptor subunit [Kiritimatiellia bacterium]
MNKTARSTVAASVAAAIAATGAVAQMQMPKMLVGTSEAKAVEHKVERKYNGRLTPCETVAVVPQVAGEIREVCFQEGATVKEGDILYRIDKVKYEAAVASARAAVAQAAASADYAAKTYARTKALFEKKVASDDDMDSATSANGVAIAALAAAEAQLVLAEDNLAHCTITAPTSGKIGLNKATKGNYVTTASGALATIVRQDPMRLAFSMSARDFADFGGEKGLAGGYAVSAQLADGSTYPLTFAFEFVENAANASTDTVTLYCRAPNDGTLLPGMTVKVVVAPLVAEPQVAVPPTAVIHADGGAYLYVLGEGDVPVRRAVTTGPVTQDYEIIVSGLAAGERVISRGTHKIIPGAPVNPVAVD